MPTTEVPTTDESVMAWMRARATADAPMQQAAARRTAEPPPVAGADRTDDVISVLGWDHNQVKYLDEQLQAIPGARKGGTRAQQEQRAAIVDMIRVRLTSHESVEQEHFWPAVRTAVPDGDRYADEAIEQEHEGDAILQELSGLDGGEDKFDELVEKLIQALRRHVAFEDRVFLEVEQAVPEAEREALGRKIRGGKPKASRRRQRKPQGNADA